MNKRILFLRILVFSIFAFLILRAGQLQLLMGNYYYQLSDGNRISLTPIHAPRGRIIDRNSNIMVSNKLSYTLYLLPNEVSPDHSVDFLLTRLSNLTGIELELLKNNYQRGKSKSSSAVILQRNLSQEAMVIIKENADKLPGLLVKESSRRDYVYGDLAPHVFGYVGEIGPEELKSLRDQGYDYQVGDIVGITGLEKKYELYLKGIDGIEQFEVNSLGERIRSLGTKPPVVGDDLILNLDLGLQQCVEALLKEQFQYLRENAEKDPDLYPPTGVATIVMETDSGAIRAMASIPGYDLNKFVEGLSIEGFQDLAGNPLNPLLNKNTMAAVPPGSIFKLVTGTAAIEYLGVRGETVFNDQNGLFYIQNWSRPYRNWHDGGEGRLNFIRAIARSNNIVFYQLGYQLYQEYKGEKLSDTARKYGLGEKTGIDLTEEKAGLVPDEEWKKEIKKEGWYPGDAVNLSIGQGGLLTTPLQLISMVNAIANGGVLYQPYLVDKIISPEGEVLLDHKPEVRANLPFRKETFRILQEGMINAANAVYENGMQGTAARTFKDFPVKIAGKTGTAQTGSSKLNHGFFAGYAPADDPEITLLIFLENGNSSGYTLPIAADIFRYYFGLNEE
jgi:penicillin-binding protein 2